MSEDDRWVEIWRGYDDAKLKSVATRLDADAIPMRIAATQACGSGSAGFSLLSLFRRRPGSRLLVPSASAARARDLLKASPARASD
jgi:hypothetical protein